ncbi:MAG TPA: hypothetical protein VIU11_15315 [Nakamurella sp.]
MTTTLITGGTGRTGRRIADRLAARGLDVRIASRSARPPFDWYDPAGWPTALDGCAAAYLCFSPDLALPGADRIIASFTAQALRRGVRRFVLLSGRGEEGARRCEDLVLAASAEATVVRCAWFQENFSEHFLRDGVLAGRVAMPAGRVAEPFVGLDDVADVAAAALVDGRWAGRVLELTGPEAITFGRAADLLAVALGREVAYHDVTVAEFVDDVTAAGATPEEAQGLGWLVEQVLDGRNSGTTDTIERVLGRPATTFAEYARRAAAAGAWSAELTADRR